MSVSGLSTANRKQKASRVFGNFVFEEQETSLCYSTDSSFRSPSKENQHQQHEVMPSPDPSSLLSSKGGYEEKHVSFVEDEEDKENASANNNNTQIPESPDMIVRKSSISSFRSAELSRLRQSLQSPQRKDLVSMTQRAINNAAGVFEALNHHTPQKKLGPSTNPSLNAARRAKEENLKHVSNRTKQVRFQWQTQKAETKNFNQRLEEQRRQIMAITRTVSSAHFQQQAKLSDEKKQTKFSKLEKEYKFNSDTYREQQEKLKEEKDKARKMSIDTRAKLRQNHRKGEEKMKRQRERELAAIHEIRYDIHKSRNEATKANAEARRKSYQFRAGDARRIRDLRANWGEEEARKQHESFLLKMEGERDADAYRKKMAEERRQSLAGRNAESRQHAQAMQELRSLAQEKEAESFMLKMEGERDAKEYLLKMERERRESLQLRGQEARRIRQHEEEEHFKAVHKGIAEGRLQSECQKDVEAYKKEMEERRRKSLQYRGKEKQMQKLNAENQRSQQQDHEREMFELDSLARKDVEEYMKDCKRRRRQSLAFRAKEKQRHAKWQQKQKEKELDAKLHNSHLRALDSQFMALSEQQERAQRAMDALRTAGCAIKGNPFGDLMNL
ncbi:unnamed protein product [Cylindrotheca closterium]|uniref:Uncharacterized protein n=1 Tax=Cylindrotheca closterium TaxID=2856 RepID=A0AAD2JLR3_9STRA|nr:unnamed protein product [Cylindrotheca closterium]